MLRSMVSTSLKFKFVVAVIAAGLVVLGVSLIRNAPVDVLPEFVVEQFVAPAAAEAHVEQVRPFAREKLRRVRGDDRQREREEVRRRCGIAAMRAQSDSRSADESAEHPADTETHVAPELVLL